LEKIANFKNEIKIKQLILKIVKLLNCINEKLIILVINEYKNLSICYQSIIWNNKKKGKKALYLVKKNLEECSAALTDKDKNILKDIFENDSFPKDELNDLNLNK
jgi:hypothetical protein